MALRFRVRPGPSREEVLLSATDNASTTIGKPERRTVTLSYHARAFNLALAGFLLFFHGVAVSSTPGGVIPCQFRIWENLDCASRLDAGRGRFDELHDEIRVICGINGRDADITVNDWLQANSDRYDPAVAESLVRTFDGFRTAYAPGKTSTFELGRQAFRRLPRAERVRIYRQALRRRDAQLDSGYRLSGQRAARDAGREGIRELQDDIWFPKYVPSLDRQIAVWNLRFRSGAESLSEAAHCHLENLRRMPVERVAELLLGDRAFGISVALLRDDLCNPVWSPLCEDLRAVLESWIAWVASQPDLATHQPIGSSGDTTLLQSLRGMLSLTFPQKDCCRHAR